MKKYFVIGNPIEHSLSPKLHNYWIKENGIDAVYEKKQLNETDIVRIISEVKDGKINGINVTVPFKKSVIPFLDRLTDLAKKSQSVNTIFKKDDKIVGDNTDIVGFEEALKNINYNVKKKHILILGAGGVVSSIIIALKKLGAKEISLSNRTKKRAEDLKKIYTDLSIIDWEDMSDPTTFEVCNWGMFINATSIGLKKNEEIKLGYFNDPPDSAYRKNNKGLGLNKLFYDVIYNPPKTNFLSKAKQLGNQIENGKMMFVYQAQLAFEIWHNIKPSIDKKVLQLLDND